VSLEHTEGAGIDLGKQPQLRQIAANQREVVLLIQLTQPAYAFHGVLVADLATNGVGRVCGINHHPAVADDLDSLFDQARFAGFSG